MYKYLIIAVLERDAEEVKETEGSRQSLAPPVLDYTNTDLNANLKCLSIYNLISVKITLLRRLMVLSSFRSTRGKVNRIAIPTLIIDCRF